MSRRSDRLASQSKTRHFDSDFMWDSMANMPGSLTLPTLHETSGDYTSFAHESTEPPARKSTDSTATKSTGTSSATKSKGKAAKSSHEHKPRITQAKHMESSPDGFSATHLADFTAHQDSELERLKIKQRGQELEIQKLQLQLEIAKLNTAADSQQQSAEASSSFGASAAGNAKSLGDLRAPQKIINPQPWPHIFAPGEPKLYNELSMPEFVSGYLVIVNQCSDENQRELYLAHLEQVMTLACNYRWSAVRAYNYKVFRSIEIGLVSWGDTFENLKQPFFIPTNLLPDAGFTKSDKTPGRNQNRRINTSQSQQLERLQICDEWSWYDNCSKDRCAKLHVCVVCRERDHQAKDCPKRKFPIPQRRAEATPAQD